MTDAVQLTQDLVRCRSVTPDEGGALQLIARLLEGAGFSVHLPEFSSPGLPEISNLYARYGTADPCFVFAGHTDVVPPGDEKAWTHPPFAAVIEDGKLYGRGAADMKSGVAASIAAALDFIAANKNFKGSIAFLITGDEEGPAVNGTVKLLEWARARGEHFSHCLLGEPTCPQKLGDMIKNGRRGSLSGKLTVHGRQGHVAYPERAENPLPKLARLMLALAEPLDSGTPHFSASNLEITTVDTGNAATNVIPAESRCAFNIRFNDLWSAEALGAEIRRRVENAAAGAIRCTLEFGPSNSPPFVTAPGAFTALVSRAIKEVTGLTPALSTTGGTSDARFIKDYCPVIEFGLAGNTMHQTDEHALVEEIESLARIYRKVLEIYFGDGLGGL